MKHPSRKTLPKLYTYTDETTGKILAGRVFGTFPKAWDFAFRLQERHPSAVVEFNDI